MAKHRIDQLIEALNKAYLSSTLTKAELASRAKLHENTLRLLGSEDWQPRIKTIRSLERVLLPRLNPSN
jgi:ribosome-binding protein aMBF1 (putative translation factor)